MLTMTPPASSSSFYFTYTYEVFLSFRGTDTRYGFTGNLYKALCDKGIKAFVDDEDLRKGEKITPTLLKAIEESRTAIIVFSQNYASSTFCLEELVKILECLNQKGRLVWPVFYEVNPSDLRHMTGSYGQALIKHEERFKRDKEKVKRWKLALQEAANLSGSHFQGSEYEHKFIGRIVQEVSRRISRTVLPVADYPVGLESRVQKLNSLLDVGSNEEVIMVGIYGSGGIGKTILARAIYNLIVDQFEDACFLADIREISIKSGLAQLQETLLSEILKEKDIKFNDVYKGISAIKSRLNRKKILLILDDVDKLDQLKKLAGEHNWFGSGSRIIISTRNEHLLHVHGVSRRYMVNELNHEEALELFSWSAFKSKRIDPRHVGISDRIVRYCNGLPLALEIIGCNLFGKTPDEFKSALEAYQRIPNEEVQEILKLSYDGLGENEKEIFLDMACFFKGDKLDYVKDVLLRSRGFPIEYAIGVLTKRSLVKIELGFVRMHDLIQEMGREIVRRESPFEPGKRSRLWFYEDIFHVFEENTGTDNIQAIMLRSHGDRKVRWNGDALQEMKNLKILVIKNASFSMGPKHLPNSLRWMDWEKYPSLALPSDFHPKKLAFLNLRRSCLESLELPQIFRSLIEINLADSVFVRRIPNISEAPNLRKMILDGCTNLIEIHDSVGRLDKLHYLTAFKCTNLKIVPKVINSESFTYLNLSVCVSLGNVPETLGAPDRIQEVILGGLIDHQYGGHGFVLHKRDSSFTLSCGSSMLPKLVKLEGFRRIRKCKVQDQERVSLSVFPGVTSLHLRVCNFTNGCHSTWLPCLDSSKALVFYYNYSVQEGISTWLPCFPALKKLNLSSVDEEGEVPSWHPYSANLASFGQEFNNLADEIVSTCLHRYPYLQELNLSGNKFTVLPECINNCRFLRRLDLTNCKQLREIRGMPPNMEYFWALNCTSLSAQSLNILLTEKLHKGDRKEIIFPGEKIPEYFDYKQPSDESFSFSVRNKFPERIAFCFVRTHTCTYNLHVNGIYHSRITLTRLFERKRHVQIVHLGKLSPIVDGWNHVRIECYPRGLYEVDVSCIGVYVYNMKEEIRKEDVQFPNPKPQKRKAAANEDMCDINRDYYPLVKKCPLLDMQFFGMNGKKIQYSRRNVEIIREIQADAKVKILLLEIYQECLPTCYDLYERGLVESSLCPICEIEYETIEHAFLKCPWTRAVWFGSDLQWIIDLKRFDSFERFINKMLGHIRNLGHSQIWKGRDDIFVEGQARNKIRGIVGNICWAIWKGRNEYILEAKPVDPALALFRANTLHSDYSHRYPLAQTAIQSTGGTTFQEQVRKNDDKAEEMSSSCNTEMNEGQDEECSWLMGFAIQLLRCLPFTKG